MWIELESEQGFVEYINTDKIISVGRLTRCDNMAYNYMVRTEGYNIEISQESWDKLKAKLFPKSRSKRTKFSQDAHDLLDWINDKFGRQFKAVPSNLQGIQARLDEGATPEEARQAIVKITNAWKEKDWEGWEQYANPVTLFRKSNFWKYHGLREKV